MEFVTLNNGLKMPMEGFGVYQVTNLLECEEAVYNAILAGYRLIDTASVYRNEEAVGNAIRRAIEEKIVPEKNCLLRQNFGCRIMKMYRRLLSHL